MQIVNALWWCGDNTDHKLEKATQMLQAGNCAISDVAYAVGYKNAHHFTAAFKKTVGLLPSEVKRGCGKGCV